jgi:hypothetical protein
VRRLAAAAVLVALGGCGGGDALEPGDVLGCLGADGITTEPRGDPTRETEVFAFEMHRGPVTRGFLIFVADDEQASSLAGDIEDEARAQGHEAHLLRVRNVVVHFFTDRPPHRDDERRMRACLDPTD